MNRRPLVTMTTLCLVLLMGGLALANDPPDRATSDWNDGAIAWRDYREGMDFVEILEKPAVLVFYTTWCPHCKNYSWVFHDPEIVRLSEHFVMIRVDRDAEDAINERYGREGKYVPRTLFLDARGQVDWSVRGSNEDYRYFLDEYEPAELRGLMQQVLRRRAATGHTQP